MRYSSFTALSLLLLIGACSDAKTPVSKSPQAAAEQPKPGDEGYVAEDPRLLALEGRAAPDITLKTIDGEPIALAKLYGHKPVYLKLWATYCGPCRVQMPGFNKIYDQYRDQVDVIAVNLGFGDDADKVRAFAKRVDMRMPQTIDDGALAAWLKMDGTPVHLLIGRDGKVSYAGHQDGPALEAALQKAVSEAGSGGELNLSKIVEAKTIAPGDQTPALALIDASGNPISFKAAGPRPKAVLLTSIWCESYLRRYEPSRVDRCKAARETVQRLATDPAVDWSVVVTHLWTKPADLPAFAKNFSPTLPVTMDADGSAFATLGVRQFPAVALIGRNGRLVRVVQSGGPELDDAVKRLGARS